MKTSIRLTHAILLILAVTGFSSCNKDKSENGIGTAEFSLNLPDVLSQLKSTTTDDPIVSYQLMISVVDMKGNSVLTDKLIPLYTFGTGFVSEKIEIKTGEFRLTKFLVINPTGAIVYATPMAGSPLAYLTKKPLPLTINIFPDKVTSVLPEVLVVGDQSPNQFGYATFGIQIIKPLDFYAMCILDNPLIMAPTQMTTAKLTIADNSGWIFSFKLIAEVNHLIIRGGSEKYTFLLEKEGYASQKMEFTANQLLAAKKENPLVLKIPVGTTTTQILSLQPGPDVGKDAMISNLESDKNFGDHKYFEATFLSESPLTVMRSNRSLMFFNLSALPSGAKIIKVILRLVYEKPIPFDATLFPTVAPSTGIAWYGAVLQQIIEPWEENKVTWNNQPKTIEANQVFIPPFIRNTNVLEIEVTKLFVSTSATPQPNHGMLFKLWPSDKFPGFRFASSDYPEASWRPKLNIQYTR